MAPIITFMTDFGTADAYAGAMKGAALTVCHDATLIDLTHDIAPHDVVEGAWVLASSFRYFPGGTVHVAVVDPGVGGERRAVAAHAGGWYFVGPDNGVLTWALDLAGAYSAVELVDPRYFRREVSSTFHGRDIFAPVAGHLASGVPLDDLGPAIDDLTPLAVPPTDVTKDGITCEVVHVDRFGNLITNLDRTTLEAWRANRPIVIECAGLSIDTGISAAYAEVAPGGLLALFESTAHLEIAAREASAARVLGARRGTPVHVRRA